MTTPQMIEGMQGSPKLRAGNVFDEECAVFDVAIGRPGRPVITPLGRFESAVQAARAHGLSPSHGHARAKRQIDGWRFEDQAPRSRRKWAIAVTTPDGDFPTVIAAARHHGICCATVEARIRRAETGWRYTEPPMPVRTLRADPAENRRHQA